MPRVTTACYGGTTRTRPSRVTEPANPNRVGIRIGPGSGHALISGNQFNMSGTAIKNESGEPSYSSGNIFGGKPGWAGQLVPCDDTPGTMRRADFEPPLK